ncbi:PhoD-like phosphatase-domain-containing protein [Mrakia frigida]|uniref:alkaline phosphatase D family protein n=1 Tax=Mrakia frigida TaxID=29902 RepID=UPI003FCC24E8
MLFLIPTAGALALASLVVALPRTGPVALESNLAYRSPSTTVEYLKIDTQDVYDGLGKRWTDTYTGKLEFPSGVASGDPYSDSVILWTMPRKYQVPNAWPPVCLQWIVSSSANFTSNSTVTSGYAQTTEEVGWSVKVEATGLQPYTKYFYRFESCEGPSLGVSDVGSFKTLPADDDDVSVLKLATFSCSNLPFGFFNAYGHAANNSDSLDFVQHLGDYIYEYKNGDYGDGTALNRIPKPDREISSLQDYRDRYASYREDPDLRELHRVLAWQTVWDDHEVADNTWSSGSANSNDTLEGQIGAYEFSQRKANAVRAYYEWMPIRQVETDNKLRIWRSFKLGKLADMIMLDTRQYDRSITDLYYNTEFIHDHASDVDRSITGTVQQKWLLDQLSESQARGATWPLVMQQVVFSRINYTIATGGSLDFNVDSWEGYRSERDNILKHIEDNKINNVVILSGDTHATWVCELTRDNATDYNPSTGAGSLGVEFAGSAVSSPSSYGYGSTHKGIAHNLTLASPTLQYAEGQMRGYCEFCSISVSCSPSFLIFEPER